MKSFLLIGQSNMAGRGDFGEVSQIINDNCYMLRSGRWQPMSEPINPDRNIFSYFHSGVGLSASFADSYARHFNEDIGLIPCADGGTSLSEWMPGEILFDNAVCQAKLAARTSEIAGILWHQGENDSHHKSDAKSYKERFTIMITELKRQLGNPNLPVILGELGEFAKTYNNGSLKYIDTVNASLNELTKEIPSCAIASSDGLGHRGDNIHFNSASYRILGERYFEAYMRLYNESKNI